MKNKKSLYYAVLAILLSTYSKIYPTFPRENGDDTFVYHGYSKSLADYGQANWLLDPMSYFGLYPFSAPSGIPFLVSFLSSVTDINIEISILLLNFFFIFIACFSLLFLSRKFSSEMWFSIFVLVCFLNSFYVLKWNNWNISPRGSFLCLLPLFLNQVLSFYKNRKFNNFSLIIIFYLLLLVTHRMVAQIIPFILIPFILAHFSQRFMFSRIAFTNSFFLKFSFFLIPSLAVLLSIEGYNLYSFFLDVIPGQRYLRDFPIEILSYPITDLSYTYSIYGSPLLFFAIFGIYSLIFNLDYKISSRRNFEIMFISSFYVLSPLLIGIEYTVPIVLPFLVIFSAIGFKLVIDSFNQSKFRQGIPVLLVLIVLLANFSGSFLIVINNNPEYDQDGNVGTRDWTTFEEFNMGLWLQDNNEDHKVAFDSIYTRNRVGAYFDVETLAFWDIVLEDNTTPFMIITRLSWFDVFTYKTGGGYGGEFDSSFTGSSGTPNEFLFFLEPQSIQTKRASEYFNVNQAVFSTDLNFTSQLYSSMDRDYWYENNYKIYSDRQFDTLHTKLY